MEPTERDEYYIEPAQDWEVDLFRPEDAEGVTRLFISVYGREYPIKTYIDPQRLIAENASLQTISIVARTARGDIVGHNALYRSAPNKGIYETGAGLVHRNYRGGKGIFTRMVAHGVEMAARTHGVEAVFGESVCNHVFTQRLCFNLDMPTQAVEVDLMPASAYATEKSATGRVSSLIDFKTIVPKPHDVYVPAIYEGALRFIYGGLDDTRDIRLSEDCFPTGSRTRIDTQVFDFAQVARIAVSQSGNDFEDAFVEAERKARSQGVTVFQAWLNLSQPWVGKAVEILRKRRYFLGGILPRWFDHDGLLMLRIDHRPHWEEMKIQFDRAREIVRLIRADWKAVDHLASPDA